MISEIRKKGMPLGKWLRIYWIMMLIVYAVVFLSSYSVSRKNLIRTMEENLRKSIDLAESYIDDSLAIVDNYIYETFIDNSTAYSSQLLYQITQYKEPVELALAKKNISSSISKINTWSDMVDSIVFYYPGEDEEILIETGLSDSYDMRLALKQYMKSTGQTGALVSAMNMHGYLTLDMDTGRRIVRVMKIDDCYFAICVSQNKIISILDSIKMDKSDIAFIANEDGGIITSSAMIDQLILPGDDEAFITLNHKRYLQTGYVSQKSGYYYGLLTDQDVILSELKEFEYSFLIIFIILMLFLPVSILFLRRCLETPLRKLARGMEKVGGGQWDTAVESRAPVREYTTLADAFNHMTSEIKNLKMINYEAEIKTQKATLQYLQMQINPHFYANVLNIIYSLAETGNYALIQQMSKAIIEYSRYIFKDVMELVSFEQELRHVNSYIEIQKLRYGGLIEYEEMIEERVRLSLVPTFVVLSFVENSMKYAFSSKRKMRIYVEAYIDNQENMLCISIRDNGEGYPPEVFDIDWEAAKEDLTVQVGLRNLYERLGLIYEGGASFRLYNEKGAVSEIRLPYISLSEVDDLTGCI